LLVSWVYGTFSTWIGSSDKNRGWEMLGDVKYAFDKALATNRLTDKQVQQGRLSSSFLFVKVPTGSGGLVIIILAKQSVVLKNNSRLNLANLYRLLGEEPPALSWHCHSLRVLVIPPWVEPMAARC